MNHVISVVRKGLRMFVGLRSTFILKQDKLGWGMLLSGRVHGKALSSVPSAHTHKKDLLDPFKSKVLV
jgi:hypothetical protein